MATDPSILVTLLNPLEAAGFVTRNRDAADRRRRVVGLTAKGTRKLDLAAEAQRQAEDTIFAGLSSEQVAQLRDLLIALRDSRERTSADETCS